MAHEIEETDTVMVRDRQAWHDLANVEVTDMTAREAAEKHNFLWFVDQYEMELKGGPIQKYTIPDGMPDMKLADDELNRKVDRLVMNVRRDTGKQLGYVSTNYRPVQNAEMIDFIDLLVEEGDKISVESLGSIRGGERVWCLVRGESFGVRQDEMVPYFCFSNGHDGYTAYRGTPTTIRVECSNTLHMVIPDAREIGQSTKLTQPHFVAHHTATIMERVEEAKAALGLYNRALEETKPVLDHLAAKDVNSEQFKQFFLQCYVRDFGAIPMEPSDAKEERQLERAMTAFSHAENRFEKEKGTAGTTWWNALNAYTGYMQHDRQTRLKDPTLKWERKAESLLFESGAQNAGKSLKLALQMAS